LDSFPIRTLDGFDFFFTVSKGFIYNVEFSNANYLLDSSTSDISLYDIGFNRDIEPGLRKQDILSNLVNSRIRFTICKIIDQFISQKQCSLVFICDSTDKLDRSRYINFQKWDEEYKTSYETIWKVIEDVDSSIVFYVGAIAFNNNHYKFLSKEMAAPFILTLDKE